MKISEWRQQEQQVLKAQEWLARPDTLEILGMIKNEGPHKVMLNNKDLTDTACIKHLGRIEGYQICIAAIEALAIMEVAPKPVPAATYQAQKPPSMITPLKK